MYKIYQIIKRYIPMPVRHFMTMMCGLAEKIVKSFHGVYFIHISDLLYPQKYGLTAIQMVVMSRLLDTRLLQKGKEPVWHLKLYANDNSVQSRASMFCKKYKNFFDRITENGFNPGLNSFLVSQNPYVGIIDGTHRLGYLLCMNPNIFVPVKFAHPLVMREYMQDGQGYYRESGISQEDIEEIQACHKEIWNNMRHSLTACFYEDEDYFHKRDKVLEVITKVGTVEDIQENICLGTKKSKITLIKFSLRYQDFYFSRGKLKSRVVDMLRKNMRDNIGLRGYTIADSVTDSISLEERLIENKANI